MTSVEAIPRAPDCERALVRMLMRCPSEAAPRIFSKIAPRTDITSPLEREIIEAFGQVYRDTGAADPLQVVKLLDGNKELEGEPSVSVLLSYAEHHGLDGENDFESLAFLDGRIEEILSRRRKRQLIEIAESAQDAARNGHSPEDVVKLLTADLEDIRREISSTKRPFTAISAAEFASTSYELNYLVPGLLVEGQPTIAAASKKGMKTSVLMDYTIAQAAAGHFLGFFPVAESRRVLFCSGESGLATLKETALRQCAAAGYNLASLNLSISTDLPKCGHGDNLEDFRTFIADEGAEVVIVDPAYLCFPAADAGNVFAQGELLRGLNDVIAEQRATLILVHHTKKLVADPYGHPELENIAWAGFQEYARQWWLLGRREPYRPGSGFHRLWLSVGGSAGHGNLFAVDIDEGTYETIGGRYWHVNVQKASEAIENAERRKEDAKTELQQKQLNEDRERVCRLLAKHPEGKSKTFIRDHCGVSSRRWPATFAAMYEADELVECEVQIGNKKLPVTGYKLTTEIV